MRRREPEGPRANKKDMKANFAPKISATEYIYLPDKHIHEELAANSFVCDLSKEASAASGVSYTLLDDTKTPYFALNSSLLLTKVQLDREHLCANSLCTEPCTLATYSTLDQSCKLNIKILQIPTYSILNMNILVHDINDNLPVFKNSQLVLPINENSPIGYTIPLELAYDPDVNANTVQKYEFLQHADLVPFSLEQNLNESKLSLVVSASLDRELKSEYRLEMRAIDPSESMSVQTLVIEIIDQNDNRPIFAKDYYKFYIRENSPLDTLIGKVYATDLDIGANGLVKYAFVDSSPKFMNLRPTLKKVNNKYFYLNESSGEVRLKNVVDYEEENFFSLLIEASDSGEVRQLTDYAHVDIEVVDENDNGPEISVSFLNSNFNDRQIYVAEDSTENKFIAHVSIYDKDSAKNAIFNWKILANNQEILKNQPFAIKVNVLNNNSFTVNIGEPELFDYELNEYFNVTIVAWDTQNLLSDEYTFRIVVLDVNDHAPKFDKSVYNITAMNAKPGDHLLKVSALDRDKNSAISYEIVEKKAKSYVSIQNGQLKMVNNFSHLSFHVLAKDNGVPSLSSRAKVYISNLRSRNKTNFVSPYKHWYDQDTLVFSVDKKVESRLKIVEFEQGIDHLGDLPKGIELYSNTIYINDHVSQEHVLINLRNKNEELKIKFIFSESENFCLNSFQSVRINSFIKFEKLSELAEDFELFYSSSNLKGIYSIDSVKNNQDLEFDIVAQDPVVHNSSLLVLKDENKALVNAYKLKIKKKDTAYSKLIIKIKSKKDPFCVLEESFIYFVDDGLLKLIKNSGNRAKSFMYKVSPVDKSEKLNSGANFLTMLMILMCVILYKKNLKKTTNILQREFSLKTEENKDQIRSKNAKPGYSYTAYKHQIQDQTSQCVKYMSKAPNFVINKNFNPRPSVILPREVLTSSPNQSHHSQSSNASTRFKILI
ncbi:protocadherin beta-17-like [Brachionus plicatilis]|uniref:Protocadherin beta-17-like n=1 Tax=Brachionus plicatilis TaxID=10195 RepID=A0A3M7RZ13_BRAPC|nr:protocadherin beta-17-like [Brachionus plicatilis]